MVQLQEWDEGDPWQRCEVLGLDRAGVTPFHTGSMNSTGFACLFFQIQNWICCLCTAASPTAGEGPRAWVHPEHDFPSWDEKGAEG